MTRKNKQILFAAIGTILLSLCVGYAHSFYNGIVQLGLIALVPVIFGMFLLGIGLKKEKLYKTTIIIVYFSLIIVFSATMVVKSGVLEQIRSAEDIINLINSYGAMGKLVFIAIQFLQVTFIPIPSTIVTAAGAAIYSPIEALVLSTIGLIIGSLFAFFLGKTFGVRLVKWIVGEEALNKYYKFVKGKDKAMLIYMFIFPAFPDDLLCMFAGLTTMGYVSFTIIQLISRPLNIAVTVFLVDYVMSIPFTGIGILIWIAIVAVFVVSMILMWKYAAKLEYYMLKGIGKLVGKPLIKDIDQIVAEEFLKKDKKKQAEKKDRKEDDTVKQEVLADQDIDAEAKNEQNNQNKVMEYENPDKMKESSVLTEEQLNKLLAKAINKKDDPMKF